MLSGVICPPSVSRCLKCIIAILWVTRYGSWVSHFPHFVEIGMKISMDREKLCEVIVDLTISLVDPLAQMSDKSGGTSSCGFLFHYSYQWHIVCNVTSVLAVVPTSIFLSKFSFSLMPTDQLVLTWQPLILLVQIPCSICKLSTLPLAERSSCILLKSFSCRHT